MAKTILNVDDSASFRQMVKLTLSSAGFNVVQAENGAEGLATATASPVDLVITDLNMPVLNGLEFIRELRKLSSFQGIPILFLTTESDDGMKQQAKAAGATGWITKPFEPERLVAVVGKMLGS
jgi:two-component system chemotaxis response regulator CheY